MLCVTIVEIGKKEGDHRGAGLLCSSLTELQQDRIDGDQVDVRWMMDAANESIQSCLETLDVLSSLFCLEGELTLDDETVDEVHRLRNALDSNRGSDSVSFEALRFTIRVSASDVDGNGLYKDACIALRVLLRRAAPVDITLGQPAWMARKHFQQLSEQLDGIVKAGAGPDSAPDATATVLEAVEFVREHGTTAYADASHSRNAQEEASPAMLDSDTNSNPTGSLVCVPLARSLTD